MFEAPYLSIAFEVLTSIKINSYHCACDGGDVLMHTKVSLSRVATRAEATIPLVVELVHKVKNSQHTNKDWSHSKLENLRRN